MFKENFKASASENIELKKSNKDEKKDPNYKESLSLTSKNDETSTIEKLREKVAWLTNHFWKFLEIPKILTTLLKFHQHRHDKSSLGFEKGTTSSKS